jgi:hypothetical protein
VSALSSLLLPLPLPACSSSAVPPPAAAAMAGVDEVPNGFGDGGVGS